MGHFSNLLIEGVPVPSKQSPVEFYNRHAKKPHQHQKAYTFDDDRPVCMREVGLFEKVDNQTVNILHQRLTLLTVPSQHHYETAHLVLLALGLRTAQSVAPQSLTELNCYEMGRLLSWTRDQWDAQEAAE